MTDRQLNSIKDSVVHKAVKVLSAIIPDVARPDYLNCGSESFLSGSHGFIKEPTKNACWSLGFAKASVLPEDISEEEYYIAGYLAYPPNRAEGIIDDMVFRAIAINDAPGRGISIFCSLDCVGISNSDIRDIRGMLSDYIEEKNIISLNISATHCHSAIDTQGIWGDLKAALKKNPLISLKKKADELLSDEIEDWISGCNKKFMDNLKATAVKTIIAAVEAMKPGNLLFCSADANRFIRDKRPPAVVIKELSVLRFEPLDSSAATVAAIMGAHPTCLGEKNKLVSADYPYYFCSQIESRGDNALFFQSAQAAVATKRGDFSPENCTNIESIKAYGTAIADYINNLDKNEFEQLEPVFNIALSEVFLPVHNSIFLLIAKMHLVNNTIVYEKHEKKKRQDEYFLITEIGYATLGNRIKLALMPGEVMPELVCGGVADSTSAYTHLSWDLPSMNEIAGEYLICMGLCNDAIGYIVPDNDYGSIFENDHYEEAVSVGDNCASNLVNAFTRLVKSSEQSYINPDFIGGQTIEGE